MNKDFFVILLVWIASFLPSIKKLIFFSISQGDHFIGEIYRILYKDANDSDNKNQSSLILKIAPSNLLRREKFRLRNLFQREINMYDQVCMILDEKS